MISIILAILDHQDDQQVCHVWIIGAELGAYDCAGERSGESHIYHNWHTGITGIHYICNTYIA